MPVVSSSELIRSRLSGHPVRSVEVPGLVPAAVLIPVFEKEGATRLLFTRRSGSLNKHAGEVSFPGGRQDEGDGSRERTALRETQEELGLEPSRVRILGELDEITTVTNYRVLPFVGELAYPFELRVSDEEVNSVFDVSIDELMDPVVYTLHRSHTWKGRPYPVHQFQVKGENIWGATGKILAQFLHVVYGWGDAETVLAGRS